MQKKFHPNNKHKNGYNFQLLVQKYPKLKNFIIENFNRETVDFSNPKSVKELNKALLFVHYGINFWDFPDENLCPPIPGRADYIHYLADLLSEEKNIKILDIGTGASCIYPLLGATEYDWNFVATDIELTSLNSALKIIENNNLQKKIELRQQFNKQCVLEGILEKNDHFTATMCNPPFYKTAEEAKEVNRRKTRNLRSNAVRNFSGNNNELWCIGGEKAFLHTHLYESLKYQKKSNWFTSLVSNKNNVKSLESSAKKLGVSKFKTIPMHQGNKFTRIVCWKF